MLVLTVAGLGAQGTATLVRQRQSVHFDEAWRPANAPGDTKIIGRIVDSRKAPVANVKVQLRNLLERRRGARERNQRERRYRFIVRDPGTYVVEMVLLDGYVLALSNAGSLARFETLETEMQLPGRWEGMTRGMVMPRNASTFMGMSAATTMTAETVRMALQQNIQPVDSGEPVSPFRPYDSSRRCRTPRHINPRDAECGACASKAGDRQRSCAPVRSPVGPLQVPLGRDRRVPARRQLGDGRQLHAHPRVSRAWRACCRGSERRRRHAERNRAQRARSRIPRCTCRRSCAS